MIDTPNVYKVKRNRFRLENSPRVMDGAEASARLQFDHSMTAKRARQILRNAPDWVEAKP
ncbi:MAG: hypothetical protein JJU29_01125 [Verrucomicrobia bacterium]|nr:hypothetical protein [Verrucomicrobiota bacterium]MCH8510491.1 hypothetical protein [Kiritimatiellia bacterium]